MIHWFVGAIDSLIHWFTDSSFHWLSDSLVSSLLSVQWLIYLLVSLIQWFTGWLVPSFIESVQVSDPLIHCFVGSLSHWFIETLLRCLIDSLVHCFIRSYCWIFFHFMLFHLQLNHHLLICWCTSQHQHFIASASQRLSYRPSVSYSHFICSKLLPWHGPGTIWYNTTQCCRWVYIIRWWSIYIMVAAPSQPSWLVDRINKRRSCWIPYSQSVVGWY